MRSRALSQAALLKIFRAAPDVLLIGGQALNWWADFYQLDALSELPEGVTFDVDFMGSREEALRLHRALGGKLYLPSLDDITPQSAKLYFANYENEGELEVDFLGSMIGGDEEGVRKRALQLQLTDARLLVLHPYDVLRTRIANLHTLSSRARNPRYVAQARLAIRVLHAYLKQALVDGEQRLVLRIVEALGELACEPAGLALWKKQGLDVLDCVPHAEIAIRSFQERRWPQLRAHIQARRG